MKALLAGLVLLTFASAASAEYVQGYIKRDGTYVPGYFRSQANGTKIDNYSSKGNLNPYTGEKGYSDPYAPSKPRQQSNRGYQPYEYKPYTYQPYSYEPYSNTRKRGY
jgi:hypothetical protein